jgi:pimeloyl-ACP methyl ester carboxylesterase
MIGAIRTGATLGRWLGPWADASKAPRVEISDQDVDGMRVRLYRNRRTPRSTYLIAPGLHYAAADDPRLDRFCRVLAASGHLVVAPFIPDYLALTPNARAIADFERAFQAVPRWTAHKPVVFSISFGSLLAFALAAKHGDALAGVVVFGGYADFHETMRFCLLGEVASGRAAVRDPLNQSVVLLNLLDHMECADRPALATAWRAYVERTWGRPEMTARAKFTALAEAMAPDVPTAVREQFLIGVGARPGAPELALPALAKFDARALDPSPYLARMRGRVDLVHGIDDDVIPYEQSLALAAKLTHADPRVHVTGMYGHTGARSPARRPSAALRAPATPGLAQSPRLGAAVRELATMLRVLRVLAR